MQRAFTLIELSIVLVIIGLIVGGVLVGRDLISSAAVRSQLTQLEKYQTAVNTFRGKFDNYLPGDIPAALVTRFSFTAAPTRAGSEGRGDGNGEIDGYYSTTAYSWNLNGESLFFWEDLSTNSRLIDGSFSSYTDGTYGTCATAAACSVFWPEAKIGSGNVVYVYSGYVQLSCCIATGVGPNFLGINKINMSCNGNVGTSSCAAGASVPALTVSQSFAMDKKVDDGMPTTGNVLAQYIGGSGGATVWSPNGASASPSTCFDTTSNQYSITQNNGNGVNCAVSFQIK